MASGQRRRRTSSPMPCDDGAGLGTAEPAHRHDGQDVRRDVERHPGHDEGDRAGHADRASGARATARQRGQRVPSWRWVRRSQAGQERSGPEPPQARSGEAMESQTWRRSRVRSTRKVRNAVAATAAPSDADRHRRRTEVLEPGVGDEGTHHEDLGHRPGAEPFGETESLARAARALALADLEEHPGHQQQPEQRNDDGEAGHHRAEHPVSVGRERPRPGEEELGLLPAGEADLDDREAVGQHREHGPGRAPAPGAWSRAARARRAPRRSVRSGRWCAGRAGAGSARVRSLGRRAARASRGATDGTAVSVVTRASSCHAGIAPTPGRGGTSVSRRSLPAGVAASSAGGATATARDARG